MSMLDCHVSHRISYRCDGEDGPAVLLFNGAGLPFTFWGTLATRLAAHCRVVRFDQRNAGLTEYEGKFSLPDIAADAARVLDCLEIESACVVGHAWGGRVAQVFARDYPHRLRGLVICGTGGHFPPVDMGDWPGRLSDARRSEDRDAWELALEAMFCAPGFRDRHPQRFSEVAEAAWPKPVARGQWQPKIAPSESYWGRTSARTLLIYGRHDKNGTPRNAYDLQQRLSAELVMFEDAGHFVVREKEDEVLDLLSRFAAKTA
ncbi:MAG: alpha/beta hydrolase [Pseudomonadales bacterium]